MAKINTQKEGIDYAKVDKLTKEIAKRLNDIRDVFERIPTRRLFSPNNF